jgi:cystathionine beta-synthase
MTLSTLIGSTPLLPLCRLVPANGPRVLVKAEFLNPGGSVKDRIAREMVDAAEASGALTPGSTIVEATSGNTGAGLALIAAERGYEAIFVCGPKVSDEKVTVLQAYGARVIRSRGDVTPDHPESSHSIAEHLLELIPGSWSSQQYENPHNPGAHRGTTGPEIWEQTGGSLTHLVANIGTGGTISGTGGYLKEVSDGAVTVIGADPAGSAYSGDVQPYLVEGAGRIFADRALWPGTYDESIVDHVDAVSDAESFAWARLAARHEGLLLGGSSGTALAAAARWAERLAPEHTLVVIPADSGRGYLSKLYDVGWLAEQGLLEEVEQTMASVRERLGLPGPLPLPVPVG